MLPCPLRSHSQVAKERQVIRSEVKVPSYLPCLRKHLKYSAFLHNIRFPIFQFQGSGQVFSKSPLIWQGPEPPSPPGCHPETPPVFSGPPPEPLASPQRLWNPGRAGGAAPGSGASSPSCRCHADNAVNLPSNPSLQLLPLPLLSCLCLLGAPCE